MNGDQTNSNAKANNGRKGGRAPAGPNAYTMNKPPKTNHPKLPPSRRPPPIVARMRADSNGSTRGAFGALQMLEEEDDPPPVEDYLSRKKHRKQKKRPPNMGDVPRSVPNNNAPGAISLNEAAALALNSLGDMNFVDDMDFGDLYNPAAANADKKKNKRNKNDQFINSTREDVFDPIPLDRPDNFDKIKPSRNSINFENNLMFHNKDFALPTIISREPSMNIVSRESSMNDHSFLKHESSLVGDGVLHPINSGFNPERHTRDKSLEYSNENMFNESSTGFGGPSYDAILGSMPPPRKKKGSPDDIYDDAELGKAMKTLDPQPEKPKLLTKSSTSSLSILDHVWNPITGLVGRLFGVDDDLEDNLDGAPPYVTMFLRLTLWDPTKPEFNSLQQFMWSCVLGIFFGVFTAYWAIAIEKLLDIVWKDVPEALLEIGVFTELDGAFPLPHYVWMCPTFFGCVLSYISAKLPTPIPGQNEWIESIHHHGVFDPSTFYYIIVISTLGMLSGMSLGPELPLVLVSGMVGTFISARTRQSVLSARVMSLTAGAAAIGGFFGFPMAGALFVLEIPHRMGLQYFEALSPATMASILAVIFNRLVTGNEIKGYFKYPFLSEVLPSNIFYVAIFYGVVGSFVGIIYAKGCILVKTKTHDLFHHHEEHHDDMAEKEVKGATAEERIPLNGTAGLRLEVKPKKSIFEIVANYTIKDEPLRAAAAGTIAGFLCGMISMLLPHNLFWGEAQLQTLIDKGHTPLPVFGTEGEPTADLTAWGYCMIDSTNKEEIAEGFGISCNFAITVTKILHIGLSLGTGIVGGHFWGPLFVGASASNLLHGILQLMTETIGHGAVLSEYPCVLLLCIMGSTHVVTFRAYMAIMLILTLTIQAFGDGQSGAASGGDYSAIFPLLVVSCYVSLFFTRDTIFYKQQRCRGDIIATDEVMREPGNKFEDPGDDYDEPSVGFTNESSMDNESWDVGSTDKDDEMSNHLTAKNIEEEFADKVAQYVEPILSEKEKQEKRVNDILKLGLPENPVKKRSNKGKGHRHTKSDIPMGHRKLSTDMRKDSSESLVSRKRLDSYGKGSKIPLHLTIQEQARMARGNKATREGSVGKEGGRIRSSSSGASPMLTSQLVGDIAGGQSQDDIERNFSVMQNLRNLENGHKNMHRRGLSASGTSVGGMSADGMSTSGMSAGGMSASGRSVGAMSVGGRSVGARSATARFSSGAQVNHFS